jgi:predicted ArsR family transcriptional regulator
MTASTPLDQAPAAVAQHDPGTRRRVLQLIAAAGPVTAAELADELELTATGVRRHIAELEQAGQVVVHEGCATGRGRRGRPARRYVATGRGQAALTHRYAELAVQALGFLGSAAGPAAVEDFAESRAAQIEAHLAGPVHDAGGDLGLRAAALAQVLTADGYAATARPVPGTAAIQLCQGHCPVQDVATAFPELCEAETRALSRVLGVHVQRLATLAGGGHVCTTSIPSSRPQTTSEGTS